MQKVKSQYLNMDTLLLDNRVLFVLDKALFSRSINICKTLIQIPKHSFKSCFILENMMKRISNRSKIVIMRDHITINHPIKTTASNPIVISTP